MINIILYLPIILVNTILWTIASGLIVILALGALILMYIIKLAAHVDMLREWLYGKTNQRTSSM